MADLGPEAHGEIRYFRIDDTEHPIEFSSLNTMIATIAEAYSQRVIYVDQDDYLEWDWPAFAELAAKIDPSVAWWNDPLV